MSIELTTTCLKIQGLTPSEKHILMVLCFRSDKYHEVYSTIDRLSSDCSCSKKTVERTLKKLRDLKILTYTGKIAPKSKNIPIYSVSFNHGLSGGGLTLTTDIGESKDGHSSMLTTDTMSICIDHRKDNRKDNGFSLLKNATPEDRQNIAWYLANPNFEMPSNLKKLLYT